MRISFYNTPHPESFNSSILPSKKPGFLEYEPDFEQMEQIAEQYKDFKNLLLIGNGGSLNSFYGYYYALKEHAEKNVFFLNTVDPDYIYDLKQSLKPEDTVVVSASKSGENTTQLECCMQFLDYPTVYITGSGSPIAQMAQKLGKTVLMHPPIGGRYAGFTEVALLPAALCGLDVRSLYAGARALLDKHAEDNAAWQTASILWQLEQKGASNVFVPIYSKHLAQFTNLIMQLCHESFGKGGKGQIYTGVEAPEWQHHSTQRFYGGPQNAAGLFISFSNFNQSIVNSVPESVHSIQIRSGTLGTLDGIPLSKSLEYEVQGNLEDAKGRGIPLVHLTLTKREPKEIGTFTAFWQLYAMYGSLLRGVDPFDQPEVEASKRLSFEMRLAYKKS